MHVQMHPHGCHSQGPSQSTRKFGGTRASRTVMCVIQSEQGPSWRALHFGVALKLLHSDACSS